MKSLSDRAEAVFRQARQQIGEDCARLHADNAAKGNLGSGATARQAVRIFGSRSGEALQQVLSEVALRIEHRGREWREAMATVSQALSTQIAAAPDLMAKSFQLARLNGESAKAAAAALIETEAEDLREKLAAFEEGWTAPVPKKWSERRPLLYALLLLLAGAAISSIFWAVGLISN